MGLQHPVQDVEALRQLPGRDGRPDDRLLAGPDQGGGYPDAVHPRDRHRADDLRVLGIELPEVVKGFTQYPLEGESFAASLHDADAQGQADAVLLDARHPRDLPRRLEGRLRDARRAECLGRLRQPALGAFQHGSRPERVPRPGRGQPREAPELIALWWAEAGKYGALPLESRDAMGILLEPRPQLAKPRDRYVYYPDSAEVPSRSLRTSATAPTRSPSRSRSTRPRPRASCSRRVPASAATPFT